MGWLKHVFHRIGGSAGLRRLLKHPERVLDPFTKVVDPILGNLGLPNLSGNDGGKAARAQALADSQAAAQVKAAQIQADAVTQASQAQARYARDQAAAAAQTQTAAINQSTLTAQLASRAEAAPRESLTPDVRLSLDEGGDPRRKYRAGGASSLGGMTTGPALRL